METNDKNYPVLLIADKLQVDGISEKLTGEQQFEALAAYLDNLIRSDFNKLVSILYRIDVSEEKVKKAIARDSGIISPGHTLAQLLIEREMQKIELRKKYSKK